jgi:hypothetical protein
MRTTSRLIGRIGLLAFMHATPALAANNACLTHGPLFGNGIRQVVHYCAANKGMSAARFQQVCQDLKDSQLAGVTAAEARKLTFINLPNCPGPIEASCDGAFGEKMSLHYMPDDTMVGNGQAKLFCQASDGKWR